MKHAIRSSLAPLFALTAFPVAACGAPDPSLEGDEALLDTESEELRGSSRFRADVQTTQTQSGLPFGIDPVTGLIIPPPRDPNVDPNSGINYDDMSNQAVDTGGACAGNVVQSGPCPTYGIQCTVNTASATLYCTCLSNNSQGIQGWECR
jgi:hypothetical protein